MFMNIVVTGGNGKLGQNIVERLKEKNKVVIAGNFNDEAKKVTVKLRDRYLNIELQPHSFNTFEEK